MKPGDLDRTQSKSALRKPETALEIRFLLFSEAEISQALRYADNTRKFQRSPKQFSLEHLTA
ncbi:hypothetical protein AB3R30_18945 [Leptolyngbyaceae cyanobacterium UHCC 1019]